MSRSATDPHGTPGPRNLDDRVGARIRSLGYSLPVLRSSYQLWHDRYRPRLHAPLHDTYNQMRYGPGAPVFAERLWIDPSTVVLADKRGNAFESSARVYTGTWPPAGVRQLQEDPVLRAAILRWREGWRWEDTGELQRMERAIARKGPIKGCRTRDDVLRRCGRLDAIFEQVKREGRLRPQGEVVSGAFREFGGVGMHIGPGGVPIRAGNGRHRFAMAWLLQLKLIPVRVGLVHADAIPLLEQLRREH